MCPSKAEGKSCRTVLETFAWIWRLLQVPAAPERLVLLDSNSFYLVPVFRRVFDWFPMSSKPTPQKRLSAIYNNLVNIAGPALFLFSGAVALWQSPLPQPLTAETERALKSTSASGEFFENNWVVPAAQTLFVTQQATGKQITVQGLLENSNEATVKSPTSGELAKLLVESGQYVEEGQEIALLTTGVAPESAGEAGASPLDQWHSRAEKEQLAAAKEQEKLESQAKAASAELARAQARVVTAQRRVADARQVIARLKAGEEILKEQVALQSNAKAEPKTQSPSASSRDKAVQQKEIQELQKAAEAAEARAKTAEKAVAAADALVEANRQKLQTTTVRDRNKEKEKEEAPLAGEDSSSKKTSSTESIPSTDGNKSTLEAADKQLAKSLTDAQLQAAQARREHARLQTLAVEARKRSNQAAQQFAQGLHLFDEEKESRSREAPRKTESSRGEKLTVTEVSRIAREAIRESNEAIADAERIQRTVDGHRQRIARSHQRFEQSAQQLREAQQRIWENVPAMRTTQTPLIAAQSGLLIWSARPLQVVKPGEAIAQIGRPDRLEVVIEDRSEAWKQLQPDQQLVALVRRKEVSPPQTSDGARASLVQASAASTSAGFRPVTAELTSNSPGIGAPSSARVLEIMPPEEEGAPARIRIAVHNPPQEKDNNQNGLSPRAFSPGMTAVFSLPLEPLETSIRIPTAAVRRGDGGKTYVAVLTPVENRGGDPAFDLCRIEWREVFLAPGDGYSNRVKMGLEEGERLVLRPNELYRFTLTYGERATVGVEQA